MSEIPGAVREALLAHADACLPNEACGYLVGDPETGRIDRFVPIQNAVASPTRFVFDPHEQLAAERSIETAGERVVGIAHSHPTGAAQPSAVDVADATRFDPFGTLLHVVIAPSSRDVRAFRILDGEITEA
ncbi:MAG: M67 family metallopeptidase [Actinomycetota bacterium]